MEETELPLSKLVEEIHQKLKDGMSAATVKNSVLKVGQRVMYGVPNVEADVLEDQSQTCLWCWEVVLVVRRRPHVTNGGGFVVTDCNQKVIFRVDGCGILGTKDELILRDGDGDGDALLLIRRKKGGMVEALSIYKKWKGYTFDYEGSQKLVFRLKEPNSCLVRNNAMKISTEPRVSNKDWDFTIKGYFPDRDCSIIDTKGDIVAQVGVKKEVQELMASKDLYHVVVKPGIDQAFVFGVIATLDYIYGESTRC